MRPSDSQGEKTRSQQPAVTLSWAAKQRPDIAVSPDVAAALAPLSQAGNALVQADNLDVLRFMAHARIEPRLIYIDPPYATQVDHGVQSSDGAALAYSDTWEDATYCQAMYERLVLMQRVLRRDGFIFVQCDWRASAWLRVMLDDVFGRACFRNEIVWRRAPNLGRQAASAQLGRTADSIFVYSAAARTLFPGKLPQLLEPCECTREGSPIGAKWDEQAQTFFTTAPRGDYSDASIERLRSEGRVYDSGTGKVYIKYPLVRDDAGRWCKAITIDTIWTDDGVKPLRHATKRELAIDYVTQKPEALLERIVKWASEPGDLVADFFAGSGTTLAVAHSLGRRFLGVDRGEIAIQTTTNRLADTAFVRFSCDVGQQPSVQRRRPRVTRRKDASAR